MKIDVNSPTAMSIQPERTSKQSLASVGDSGSTLTSDRTTLNSSGGAVKLLTQQAMQSPEIRQDKVDEIRQAVSNGQYRVDPGKIADAMIASQDE